jgi:hypothetical protein
LGDLQTYFVRPASSIFQLSSADSYNDLSFGAVMQRREFINTLAGGAVAAALPTNLLCADKVYRIGQSLAPLSRSGPEATATLSEQEA